MTTVVSWNMAKKTPTPGGNWWAWMQTLRYYRKQHAECQRT